MSGDDDGDGGDDDLAVLYDKSSSDKATTDVDEDISSFQASYTMAI